MAGMCLNEEGQWLRLGHLDSLGRGNPCATALLLVAHRDDETFFAGHSLQQHRFRTDVDSRVSSFLVVFMADLR